MAGHQLQVHSQVVNPLLLESELDYCNRNGYLEKLFLDTDKDLYFAGEKVRFSIVALEGKFNTPNALSNIAYIEILDPENQSVVRGKFRLNNSRGAGILNLPETLCSGNYILRAYTNWMRNFSPDYYFHQIVTIINPKQPAKVEYMANNFAQVVYRPESGSLITGIENKVAVRITNRFKNPFLSNCVLVGEKGDTIENILLDNQGLGLFTFTPEHNKSYGIPIEDSLFTLPPSKENAANLYVEENDDSIRIRIYCSGELINNDNLLLILHQHGEIIDVQNIYLQENLGESTIKRNKLPAGISEIVLLNQELQYLASRCIIGKSYENGKISVETSLSEIKKRDTLSLKISTTPGALLSVSVFLPLNNELPEELVHETIHYKSELGPWKNIQTNEASLVYNNETSGSYNKIIQKAPMKFPPEIRADLLSGNLVVEQQKKTDKSRLYMATIGENSDIETLKLERNGYFYVSAPDICEPTQLYFVSDSLEMLNILIENEFSTSFADISTETITEQIKHLKNFQKLLIASQISKIYGQDTPTANHEKSINFYGIPDETILFTDYIELPVMEEFFRELVRYSIFTREKGSLKLNVLSKYSNRILGPDPLFLVDGIPVFSTQKILGLNPETIRKISVKANRYFYGNTVMDGIIDIESIEGDGGILNSGETIVNYYYEPPAELKHHLIARSNIPDRSPSIPDQRTVICWEPTLKSDANGCAEVKFSASDISGTYHIKITAISTDGKIGRITKTIRVE